jgi:hypothetical protein
MSSGGISLRQRWRPSATGRAAIDVSSWRMGSPPRWIPAFGALVWAVWILRLGTDDRRNVVGLSGTASEAIQHIVAFVILGALVMLAARRRRWLVFGLVAVAGVLGEFVQLAVSARTFSFVDMLFSVAGAVIGVAAIRRTDWPTTLVVMMIAGLLIAIAPRALELSDGGPDPSFPADCSAPPTRAECAPEVVLDAHPDADRGAAGRGATRPIEIEEPATAAP